MLVKEKQQLNSRSEENLRKVYTTRRNDSERRKNITQFISILDRRNIEGRRTVKDRRISKIKPQFSPIAEQGVTISGLISEQSKGIKSIIGLRNSIQSKGHVERMNALKDLYFAFNSQLSKEKILYQWYDEASKNSKVLDDEDEVPALVFNIYFLFRNDMKDVIGMFDKYLNLKVEIESNLISFQKEMDKAIDTLAECLKLKEKYLYPQYKEYLMV
ncbi:MAG: hypothetical protein V3V19_09880 [Cocleimonas sp.]